MHVERRWQLSLRSRRCGGDLIVRLYGSRPPLWLWTQYHAMLFHDKRRNQAHHFAQAINIREEQMQSVILLLTS